ncbi:MAG: hypothetical protein Fur0032_21010 [Terrimicrobiaceae bacterium]
MLSGLPDQIYWGVQPGGMWLATTDDAVTAFAPTGNRQAVLTPLVRSRAPKADDYENITTSLNLSVTRQFASPSVARSWMLSHLREFAALGSMTLASDQALITIRYTSAETYIMRPGLVRRIAGNHIGATTMHQYEIIGGPIE